MEILLVETIGSKAFELIKGGGNFNVQGITSRGVFLNLDSEWMLFLAEERFRGPLTINVPELARGKDCFSRLAEGVYEKGVLSFPDVGLGFDVSLGQEWRPILPKVISGEAKKRAFQHVERINDPLVEALRGKGVDENLVNSVVENQIVKMSDLLRRGDLNCIQKNAETLLGLGQGLTPEGDDFIIGLLYTLRIDNDIFDTELRRSFNTIIELARRKTTRLSANLIECAAHGLVDERISNLVNALYFEGDLVGIAMEDLLAWGSTSGRMVLAGISAGIIISEG